MPRRITSATSLDNLRKEAKRWLKALRAGEADARARLERAVPGAAASPTLRDVQHALAREYGHESWRALRDALAGRPQALESEVAGLHSADEYDRAALDLVSAFESHDQAALDRLNAHYHRAFTFDDLWAEIWRRVYSFRQRAFKGGNNTLQLDEAQTVVAQDAGFSSWAALIRATKTGARPVPPYAIDPVDNRIGPTRQLTTAEWDELIAVMKERRITALDANGEMTDAVMARVAGLDHVTALSLGGSRQLTDEGLRELARMPQLQHLDLSEYPGGKLTDRGLEVLRHLPNLRTFDMTWQRGITDNGVGNLRVCDRLERVNLMGSPTGDGAIEALQGKPKLRQFSSGRLATDAGLALLPNLPALRNAPADEASGAKLLIDGPFSNDGLARLASLEGVVDLDLFWHVTAITTDAFAYLAAMPNLMAIGADGALADNVSMRHFGRMPRLRRLRAQGTRANDEGFEALGRSRTLEGLWTGKDTVSLGARGFLALAAIPTLRVLGVSLKHVDDDALSALPRFPALRELTPIDATDEQFRHVGRCERLERLTCMYCRETTDAATAYIAGLGLSYYYAGLTQITDRSLEILGRMATLEQIEFYECKGITDAGLPFLAALPRLREVHLGSLPGVTFEGTRVFPPRVRVKHST